MQGWGVLTKGVGHIADSNREGKVVLLRDLSRWGRQEKEQVLPVSRGRLQQAEGTAYAKAAGEAPMA